MQLNMLFQLYQVLIFLYLFMNYRFNDFKLENKILLLSLSQMDGEEVFGAFNASGSADTKFSARMYKHEEIKQENFDGQDAAA